MSTGPDPHDVVLARFTEACRADDRVVAAFLGGSRARGEADARSDLDLCMIVADDADAALLADREAFVRALGEPVFLEHFGDDHHLFVILADGVELELIVVRASDVRSIEAGPHRVLVDDAGLLVGASFPVAEPDPAARTAALDRLLRTFWHDVGHFTTAIARDQTWWAAGQLEALRAMAIDLVRIEQGGVPDDEASWKLDAEIDTSALEPLRGTFVEIDRDELLGAGRAVVAFFREHGRVLAVREGLTYPESLDRVVSGPLDEFR